MKPAASIVVPVLFSCLMVPVAGQGQENPGAASRGDRSILLSVGERSDIGYWMRVGESTDLGVGVGLTFSDDDERTSRAFHLSPELKRYWDEDGASIAPYVLVGLVGSWRTSEDSGTFASERSALEIGGAGGIGLDWFPVERVSVGGHVGLRATFTRSKLTQTSPGAPPEDEATRFLISTHSAGIRLHVYF